MERGARRSTVTLWLAGAVLVALAGGRSAHADCNVSPMCVPNDEGTGCCNPDCTLKSAGDDCRLVDAPCMEGRCTAQGACTANGRNAKSGSTCFFRPPFDVCLRGECHNGACSGIGGQSSTEYGARCPDTDANPCTDHCLVDQQTGAFVGCGTAPTSDTHRPCYVVDTNGGCVQGTCAAAQCALPPNPIPQKCAPPAPCRRTTCDPAIGCSSEGDANAHCDDNPSDCRVKYCTTAGNCVVHDAEPDTPCVAQPADDDHNLCTAEACNGSGDCRIHKPYADGTPCQLDVDTCTRQECRSVQCVFAGCDNGPCALCGLPGAMCQGTTAADCRCVFP